MTVRVDHCSEAYGLILKHQHGWKIVYSGDTRPCPGLIKAGMGMIFTVFTFSEMWFCVSALYKSTTHYVTGL